LDEFQRIAEGKATTMGHIQRHHLEEAIVIIPDTQLFRFANDNQRIILEKKIKNNIENKYLEDIRNITLRYFFEWVI